MRDGEARVEKPVILLGKQWEIKLNRIKNP
jgi:hypothetical protein